MLLQAQYVQIVLFCIQFFMWKALFAVQTADNMHSQTVVE